jgi:hypothetical protein
MPRGIRGGHFVALPNAGLFSLNGALVELNVRFDEIKADAGASVIPRTPQ